MARLCNARRSAPASDCAYQLLALATSVTQSLRMLDMLERVALAAIACYWSYRLGRAGWGVFKNRPSVWADALGVTLPIWYAIGWVNVGHSLVWATMALLALIGQFTAVLYLGIFTYGMMITDLMVSVPMYDRQVRTNPSLYPRNFRRVTANIMILQGMYVICVGCIVYFAR